MKTQILHPKYPDRASGSAFLRWADTVWLSSILAVMSCAGGNAPLGDDDDNDDATQTPTGTSTATGATSTTSSGGSAAVGGHGQGGGSSGTGGSGPNGGSSAAGGAGSGGGPVVSIPICQLACVTVSQCDLGSAPYDPDNYSCGNGYCQYEGCNSDAECQTLGNYRCRDMGGSVPFCLPACGTVADCNLGTAPYDADNYSCSNGVCVYQGCNSDSECMTIGNYLCRDTGSGPPMCLAACNGVSECDMGSAPYDVDNYSCSNGVCIYQGCNSDSECQTLGNYVCR